MPSPRDGTVNNLVTPAPPRKAVAADKADPGEMAKLKAEQQESGKGKYGETPVQTHKPAKDAGTKSNPEQGEEEKKQKKPSWIALKLVDAEGEPIPGEPYKVVLPDGETVATGTTDENGCGRVDGIDPGQCKISFPNRDKTVVKPK